VETAAESLFALLVANVTKEKGKWTWTNPEMDRRGNGNLHKKVKSIKCIPIFRNNSSWLLTGTLSLSVLAE